MKQLNLWRRGGGGGGGLGLFVTLLRKFYLKMSNIKLEFHLIFTRVSAQLGGGEGLHRSTLSLYISA